MYNTLVLESLRFGESWGKFGIRVRAVDDVVVDGILLADSEHGDHGRPGGGDTPWPGLLITRDRRREDRQSLTSQQTIEDKI